MVTRYIKNNFLYAAGDTIVGQVRKANEDNCGYCKTPNGELFVVCDGMGGHAGGATASHIAVESIINYIRQQVSSNKAELIDQALRFANTQILGTAANDPSLRGMGTTACVLLIDGQDIWIGHVGDSRIYLYSEQENYLYRITKDHSLVQSLVDRGELDDRDAESHPQKNVILMALGTKPEVQPDVEHTPIRAQVGDTFLICSDGLSGMIDDNEIENIMHQNSTVEDKVQNLIDAANMPGKGKDNITAQLIKVLSSEHNVSSHPNHNPRWRAKGGMPVNSRQTINQQTGRERPVISTNLPPRRNSNSWIPAISAVAAVIIIAVIIGFIFAFPKIKDRLGKDDNAGGGAGTEAVKEDSQGAGEQPVVLDNEIVFVKQEMTLNPSEEPYDLNKNVRKPIPEIDKLSWELKESKESKRAAILGVSELDLSNITKNTTLEVIAQNSSGDTKSFIVQVEIPRNKQGTGKGGAKAQNPNTGGTATSEGTEGTETGSTAGTQTAAANVNADDNESAVKEAQTDINVSQNGEDAGIQTAESAVEGLGNQEDAEPTSQPEPDSQSADTKDVSQETQQTPAEPQVQTITIKIGKELRLEDIFNKEKDEDLYKKTRWTSNDKSIVTVINYNGKISIKGNKKGEKTTVTGKQGSKEVYIINVEVK